MPATLDADRPAGARNAVAFCCDANFAPYALLAAERLRLGAPPGGAGFDICLVSTEPLTVPPGLAHLDIRICRIATGGTLDGLARATGREAPYLRLLLPEAMAGEYDRILYLDCDIFPRHGDVARLLASPLHGAPFAAVRDLIQWFRPRRRAQELAQMGLPSAPYCNTGVMLIDPAAFAEAGLLAPLLALGEARPELLLHNDQSLINCVLRGWWAELHPTWNWQMAEATALPAFAHDARLLHFTGRAKPWKRRGAALPGGLARRYGAFLAHHFPEIERKAPLDGAAMPPPGAYLRPLPILPPLRTYLGRFPDIHAALPPPAPRPDLGGAGAG
jgi:hypothetical protein